MTLLSLYFSWFEWRQTSFVSLRNVYGVILKEGNVAYLMPEYKNKDVHSFGRLDGKIVVIVF